MNEYPELARDDDPDYIPDDDISLDESSFDDSDLDDALFGILPAEESLVSTTRRKSSKKKKRTAPYSLKKKKKSKPKTTSTPSKITPELEGLMQEAYDAYLGKDFALAVEILEEIVRRSPGLHDPLQWLGLIYENEYNDKEKAINYYFLAAHLISDFSLWKQIGKMSQELENYNQAIYCYRRCQKNTDGAHDSEVAFELARCLKIMGDDKQSVYVLHPIFDQYPDNSLFALELGSSLYRLERYSEATKVIENYMEHSNCKTKELDINCIGLACELYLKAGKFVECKDLVYSFYEDISLPDYRLDLVVKLAVAEIQLDEYHTSTALQPLLWAKSPIPDAFHDSFYEFGNAYFARGIYTQALKYFQAIVDSPKYYFDNHFWILIADCHLKTNHPELAEDVLKKAIEINSKLSNRIPGISDAELRLKYSEVLGLLNRHEEADQMLISVSYKNLRDVNTLPKPLSIEQRQNLLDQLLEDFESVSADNANKDKKTEWLDTFFRLIEDSELDTQRIIRQSYQNKIKSSQDVTTTNDIQIPQDSFPTDGSQTSSLFDLQHNTTINKKKLFPKVIHHFRIKKEMELIPLEEFIGWAGYETFLRKGVDISKQINRLKELVEILEMIISNKRQDRSIVLDVEKKLFRENLERLSLELSYEAEIYKVSLTHLRANYMQNPESSNQILQVLSKILFQSKISLQSSNSLSGSIEKDILLENRAWTIRQLLRRPQSYPLIMIAAHFCTLSSRWPFAVAEYLRAHRILPGDDLTVLCLATAYINLSTSRVVQDRHATVLKGFTFLSKYMSMRLSTAQSYGNDKYIQYYYKAENYYNLGRAYHQLGITNLSIQMYLRCLNLLDSINQFNQPEEFYSSENYLPNIISLKNQLSRLSAYNLFIIWKSQQNRYQALWISRKYFKWE